MSLEDTNFTLLTRLYLFKKLNAERISSLFREVKLVKSIGSDRLAVDALKVNRIVGEASIEIRASKGTNSNLPIIGTDWPEFQVHATWALIGVNIELERSNKRQKLAQIGNDGHVHSWWMDSFAREWMEDSTGRRIQENSPGPAFNLLCKSSVL